MAVSLIIGLSLLLQGAPTTGSPIRSLATTLPTLSLITSPASHAAPDDKDMMFVDVAKGYWTYAAVTLLQHHKILLGYPDRFFSGKRVLTRYEFGVAVKRAIDSLIPPPHDTFPGPPGATIEAPGPAGLSPSSEDIKLLRKLALEFKTQLLALGMDWKTADLALQKLQDKELHAEIAASLATYTPKTGNNSLASQDVKRPNWAYDAVQHLAEKKMVMQPDDAKIYTYYEFAVIVKRGLAGLSAAEAMRGSGVDPKSPAPVYMLNDVLELHKLARSFRDQLAQLGVDLKATETMLTLAEEKRITAEETIDARPPVLPVNP